MNDQFSFFDEPEGRACPQCNKLFTGPSFKKFCSKPCSDRSRHTDEQRARRRLAVSLKPKGWQYGVGSKHTCKDCGTEFKYQGNASHCKDCRENAENEIQ